MKRHISFVIICLGMFLVILDTNILNIILPIIKRDLNLSVVEMSWVTNIYLLAFTSCLFFCTYISKKMGYKRGFLIGVTLFFIGSLICSFYVPYSLLLLGRLLQGIGSAFFAPITTLLIKELYKNENHRATAFGIWSGITATAFLLSPIIGGYLGFKFGYTSVFIINLPVTLLIIIVGTITIPSKSESNKGRIKWIQHLYLLLLVNIFIISLVYIEQNKFLVITLTLTIWLFLYTFLKNKITILPRKLFNLGNTNALLSGFIYNFSCYGIMFLLSIYYQEYLDFNSIRTGLMFIPMTTSAIIFTTFLSPHIVKKFGTDFGQTISLVAIIVGVIFVAISFYLNDLIFFINIGYVLIGFSGMIAPFATNSIYKYTQPKFESEISALLNIFRQSGSLLSVAILSVLLSISSIQMTLLIGVILIIICSTLILISNTFVKGVSNDSLEM